MKMPHLSKVLYKDYREYAKVIHGISIGGELAERNPAFWTDQEIFNDLIENIVENFEFKPHIEPKAERIKRFRIEITLTSEIIEELGGIE